MQISRRAWLAGMGAIAGATWLGERAAVAAPTKQKSAVISFYFEGGFNAIFSSADSFAGRGSFGVTSSNVTNVGNGLVVDKATMGSLGTWALGHMASIGNRHGIQDHGSAQKANFNDENQRNYLIRLAAAIGGDAAFKAVALGDLPAGQAAAESGVSLQLLRSMGEAASAVGVGPVDFNKPARNVGAKGIDAARSMSSRTLTANPNSLSFAKDGYDTVQSALSKPPIQVDPAAIAQAYGADASSEFGINVGAKLAAAELLLRGGTNVISLTDHSWDSHGDSTGSTVRNNMSQRIIPALKTFIGRLQSEPDLAAMNITLMLHGDFARNLPTSDHAPGLSALVIGNSVKTGTTGAMNPDATLPESTGKSNQMWSYLAAAARCAVNPFGDNPYTKLIA
jgi:hypothetical protein